MWERGKFYRIPEKPGEPDGKTINVVYVMRLVPPSIRKQPGDFHLAWGVYKDQSGQVCASSPWIIRHINSDRAVELDSNLEPMYDTSIECRSLDETEMSILELAGRVSYPFREIPSDSKRTLTAFWYAAMLNKKTSTIQKTLNELASKGHLVIRPSRYNRRPRIYEMPR